QFRRAVQPNAGRARVSLPFPGYGSAVPASILFPNFFRFRDVIVKRSALSRNLVSWGRGKAIQLTVVISHPFANEKPGAPPLARSLRQGGDFDFRSRVLPVRVKFPALSRQRMARQGRGTLRSEIKAGFAHARNGCSILWHLGINPVRPGQNPSGEVVDFFESRLAQEIYRFGAAYAAAAVGHYFLAGVELVYAIGEIAQWNQVPAEIADLVFVRLADVEYEYIVTAVEALLQFFHL